MVGDTVCCRHSQITHNMEYGSSKHGGRFILFGLLLQLAISKGAAITVTVESSGSAIYVPEKTAFNCSFTTTYNLTQVTWTRTFGGQNETVYIDTNGSGTALGNLSMRADGELGERFHILHVHNVTVYDSGTYYCLVEDANNDTDSGNVFVDIYYYTTEVTLNAVAFGANSTSCPPAASPYLSIAPFSTDIVCTLPYSKPLSNYTLLAFDDATNMTVNVGPVAIKTETIGLYSGVASDVITTNLTFTEPGLYRVTCVQVYQFPENVSAGSACLDIKVFESNASKCVLLPCQNNGQCESVGDSYNCTCTVWYTGTNCQTRLADPCDPNPCENGGSCSGEPSNFTCDCTTCFSGAICGNQTVRPCTPDPCQENFTCSDAQCPAHTCTCLDNTERCRSVCAVMNPPPATIRTPYGSSVNVTCEPPDADGAAITWAKDGNDVMTGNVLSIMDADADDAGTLTCKSSGPSCIPISISVLITVTYELDAVTTDNESLSLANGTSKTLTCTATGQPTPLLYWVFYPTNNNPTATQDQPTPENNMSEQTNNSSNETTTAEPETTTTTTTPAPTVSNKVLPQVLTSMTPGSSQLVLTGVHKNNEGTYICKAHLMNLTSSDVIIRTVNISLASSTGGGPVCCTKKGGLAAWKIAIIVLIFLIIIVVVVVGLLIFLKKGKEGSGPFACCFVNAVHPDVKDVGDTHNNNKSPAKTYQQYSKTYEDEIEMEKKNARAQQNHIRRNSYTEGRRNLVKEDDDRSRSRSDDDEDDHTDNYSRSRRPRTPSPRSQGPIGSRSRALPPLDLDSERMRTRKKKRPRRNQETENGMGGESPRENRRDFNYREY